MTDPVRTTTRKMLHHADRDCHTAAASSAQGTAERPGHLVLTPGRVRAPKPLPPAQQRGSEVRRRRADRPASTVWQNGPRQTDQKWGGALAHGPKRKDSSVAPTLMPLAAVPIRTTARLAVSVSLSVPRPMRPIAARPIRTASVGGTVITSAASVARPPARLREGRYRGAISLSIPRAATRHTMTGSRYMGARSRRMLSSLPRGSAALRLGATRGTLRTRGFDTSPRLRAQPRPPAPVAQIAVITHFQGTIGGVARSTGTPNSSSGRRSSRFCALRSRRQRQVARRDRGCRVFFFFLYISPALSDNGLSREGWRRFRHTFPTIIALLRYDGSRHRKYSGACRSKRNSCHFYVGCTRTSLANRRLRGSGVALASITRDANLFG